MKYIDADELRAKIERLIMTETSEPGNMWDEGFSTCGGEINDIITSLQQEQPSLPSDLDEAANDSWALYEYRESPKGLYSTCYIDGFKAGAEWMAGQGVTVNGRITRKYVPEAAGHIEKITANFPLAIRKLIPQDTEAEVTVQIRKKQ